VPQKRLITLSRAQTLALRLSQSESVAVSGGSGSGKTFLANAMALRTVQTGSSCLLVGPDRYLDRPASFRTPDGCQSILLQRAQQGLTIRSVTALTDPLEARARLSRGGLRSAQTILRRAKELLHAHALTAAEVEQSVVFSQPISAEAADLVSVICQDAARAADGLWSGNKRAGRSLGDVLAIMSNSRAEIPPDEAATLISADDGEFDERLAALAARAERSVQELALAAAIATLRNPAPSDKTLVEVYRHYGWMSQALQEATELLRQHESLQAAVANDGNAPGARIIQAFVRNRPGQSVSEAIKIFEVARLRYEEDATTLEPYLFRYGLRTLKSVSPCGETAARVPAEFAQRIREARQALKRLPDLLARLKAVLPQPLVDEMIKAPIEEGPTRTCAFRVSDPRALAAMELRELRSLFAATGFGDVLSSPPLPESPLPERPATAPPPQYSPTFLDLLLDIDAESDVSQSYEGRAWPQLLTRARTAEELAGLAATEKTFEVVVVDDADRFSQDLLERLSHSRLHRLGVASVGSTVSLEQGFRVGGSISVRLEPPDTVGLVIVEARELEAEALPSAARRLAQHLQHAGYDTGLAIDEGSEVPGLLVTSADTAEEKQVCRLLDFVRDGVVVLYRSWHSEPDLRAPLSADARAALSLGWCVLKTFTDGVLLEKDGRVVALINEPESAMQSNDLVVDLVRRMEARGWSPVVCWRDAPRNPAELGRLLEARATALERHAAVVNLVRKFDLSPPPPIPQPPNDEHGPEKRAEADSNTPAAVSDDSADRVGESEPVPEASTSERFEGVSVAPEHPPVTVQETGSSLADSNEHHRPEAAGVPSEAPPSPDAQEEGFSTVVETSSTGRASKADLQQEAAAAEQSSLSEISRVLEVPSEPPPTFNEAADEEIKATVAAPIRHFLRQPLELPDDIGTDDDRILRAANDILLAHLKLPDSIRFLSDVTFGPEMDARLADTLRRTARYEQVRARMFARPYAEAFERVSTSYPVLLLWTMATAVAERYATSSERDVWQHAFRAIGLDEAEVGPFTSETVSSKISAIARLYRFDCNTQDGYRHCMKLFLCGGVPKSQMGILAEAFRSAERRIGSDEEPPDGWIREAVNEIPIGYTRLRRILRHPDAVAYADVYKRVRNGQSATSAAEAALLAALNPSEPSDAVRETVFDQLSLRPPTIVWRNELRVASAGYATEILDGSDKILLSLWPDDEFAVEPALAFDGFGWRVQGTNTVAHASGILQSRPFAVFDEDGAELRPDAENPPDGALFTVVARAPFVLCNGDETCEAHEYRGVWLAAGLFSPEAVVEIEGSVHLIGSPVASDTLKPEFAEGGHFVRCGAMPGLAVGLEGFGLVGAGEGVIEVLLDGALSKEIRVEREDILPVEDMGLPEDRAAEVRVRVRRDGRITATGDFVWWPGLHRYDGTSLPHRPANLLEQASRGIVCTDQGCAFDSNDPISHVTVALSGVRHPLRLAKRGVHLSLRQAEQTEWLPKGGTVLYRRGESDGRLRVVVSGEEGTLCLYGGRSVRLGSRRSWYDVALQGALADKTERVSDAVEWTPTGGETITLFRLVEAGPVVRWDKTSLIRTEHFPLQLGIPAVVLTQATALDVSDLTAFDRLGAQGVRDCAFLEYAPDNREDLLSFHVDLGRLPGRAAMWRLEYRLASPGQSWDDAELLGAARYYRRRSPDLALPTGVDYEHLCRGCSDASGEGQEDLAAFLRAATLELPKRSSTLISGFAESFDTWRGASAFDAYPDLLVDADWAALACCIVTRWSIDADECPPMRFLGGVPNRLARSLEQRGNQHCTAVFDYLVPDGVPKIRPRDPYSLLKPEVHLWAYHMALERLRRWRHEGMHPEKEQMLIAAARRMAQLTSRVTFKAERLFTCRRDNPARELARHLSPALFGFLWCTRGKGYPLSGQRSVPHEWLEKIRLQARDVGLLLRLAPEMLAFHLVLVENLSAAQQPDKAAA
jgi:hypothetical protein